jgi:hypothetical protein
MARVGPAGGAAPLLAALWASSRRRPPASPCAASPSSRPVPRQRAAVLASPGLRRGRLGQALRAGAEEAPVLAPAFAGGREPRGGLHDARPGRRDAPQGPNQGMGGSRRVQ